MPVDLVTEDGHRARWDSEDVPRTSGGDVEQVRPLKTTTKMAATSAGFQRI